MELDVAGLVDAMDVTEAGGDGEVGADGGEGLVDFVDVFRLGVERVVVYTLVVNSVLLTTSDTNFLEVLAIALFFVDWTTTHHLQPLLHGSSSLQVLGGCFDVPVHLLFREIDHMT